MDTFEYLAVLVSVIIGLGISNILSGINTAITNRQSQTYYWVHTFWVINVFLQTVFFWWYSYRWSAVIEWNFFLFLFVLMYAIIIYLLCASLFPPSADADINFKERFYQNRKWFFFLFALAMFVDYFDTYIKHLYGAPLPDMVSYVGITTTILVGSIIGIWTKNARYHGAFAIAFAIFILYQIYASFLQIANI
jgi:hypothetical protein